MHAKTIRSSSTRTKKSARRLPTRSPSTTHGDLPVARRRRPFLHRQARQMQEELLARILCRFHQARSSEGQLHRRTTATPKSISSSPKQTCRQEQGCGNLVTTGGRSRFRTCMVVRRKRVHGPRAFLNARTMRLSDFYFPNLGSTTYLGEAPWRRLTSCDRPVSQIGNNCNSCLDVQEAVRVPRDCQWLHCAMLWPCDGINAQRSWALMFALGGSSASSHFSTFVCVWWPLNLKSSLTLLALGEQNRYAFLCWVRGLSQEQVRFVSRNDSLFYIFLVFELMWSLKSRIFFLWRETLMLPSLFVPFGGPHDHTCKCDIAISIFGAHTCFGCSGGSSWRHDRWANFSQGLNFHSCFTVGHHCACVFFGCPHDQL